MFSVDVVWKIEGSRSASHW